jgi:hypothetical protein
MTNEQQSRLSMYLAVRDFLTPNASITTSLPNFSANTATLQSTIPLIQSTAEQQKIDKTGISDSKKQLKATLVTVAADNSRKLIAFAKFTNNLTLLNEINFTESDFRNSSDTDLKDIAQIVYDFAQTNLASLAAYNITATTQTALLAAINAYNTILASPRVGTVVSSQATGQLITLYKTADTALNNIDTTIEIIKLAQPAFYAGYHNARKIIETGTGSLALKGLAVELQNGLPVQNATFTFKPANDITALVKTASSNGNGNIVKKTAAKGIFNIKSMAEGTYSVTITKPGYKDQVTTVNIVNGEKTNLKVELEKA